MKLQFASDLHLEFHENSRWLRQNPLTPVGDVLLLAGDIGYLGDDNYSKHPFWSWAADHFEQVIAIPGNHELYKDFDINELHEGWTLDIRPNVKAYYNQTLHLNDDVDLVLSTLWAHVPPEDAFYTERGVTDFHRIHDGKFRLSSDRFNLEHERCKEFIRREVTASKVRHILVATHHVPSFALMAKEFVGSPINGAFTAELGNMIAEFPIEYWIYGHSHRNIEATIGNTRCVCNQLGYIFQTEEQKGFRPDAAIELK